MSNTDGLSGRVRIGVKWRIDSEEMNHSTNE